MAPRSALYVGHVVHSRHAPRRHVFRYRIAYLFLDLDELEEPGGGPFRGRRLWSVGRRNVAAFRREDYLGDPRVPLAEAVRARAIEALGIAPSGPVRVLTLPRQLGYCFNPVSFYYLYEPDGETLGAIVAEITNTPWGERHSYVIASSDARRANTFVERFPKAFHVSPFFDMTQDYVWRFEAPAERLVVAMENHEAGVRVLDVGLALQREPMTGPNLAKFLARHPLACGAAQLAIHWQALRLWLKRTPFFAHPAKR
jgi:DUF1365 family protein